MDAVASVATAVDKWLRDPLEWTEENWGLGPDAVEQQAAMEALIPMAAPRVPKAERTA